MFRLLRAEALTAHLPLAVLGRLPPEEQRDVAHDPHVHVRESGDEAALLALLVEVRVLSALRSPYADVPDLVSALFVVAITWWLEHGRAYTPTEMATRTARLASAPFREARTWQ